MHLAPTSDRAVRSGTRLNSQGSSARRRQADAAKAATAANPPNSAKPGLPPMIQGGTYAINMLCRSPVTSHAITMVIIGMFDHLQYSSPQANQRSNRAQMRSCGSGIRITPGQFKLPVSICFKIFHDFLSCSLHSNASILRTGASSPCLILGLPQSIEA